MKKILVALSLIIGLSMQQEVIGQVSKETTVEFNKTNQNATVGEFKYTKTALETVLKQRFAAAKLGKSKSASSKFQKFEGVIWNEVSADKLDIYYRVSGKKDKSTVEFLVSKGYDNFISGNTDAATVGNLKNFIASLEQDLIKYDLNALIEAKEKAVKTAEKNVNDSKDDVAKAEKAVEKAKSEVKKREDAVNQLKGELEKLKAQK